MRIVHKSSKPAVKSRRLRLQGVEPLEARIAPATIMFQGNLGAGTYSWHDNASWIGGVVPGLGDDVIIDAANRSMIVTITQPVSVKSITMASDETLSVSSSFTTTELTASQFGILAVASNALVNVSGTASHADNLSLGGTLAGTLTVDTLATLNSQPKIAGKLNVAGDMTMGNLYLDLTTAQSELRILNGGDFIANSSGFAIRHQGTTTSAGMTIESGGALDVDGGTLNIEVPLTVNNGSITLTGGNLNISQSSTLNSPIISVGATKNLDINGTSATATVSGTVTSTGAGTVSLQRGTLAGTATLNFAPGQFVVIGEANLAGAFTIPASSDLSVAGGSPNLSGTLSVSGKIIHGNAYLDLVSTTAAVRVLSGGTYEAASAGFAIRHQVVTTSTGLTIESGGTLKSTTSTFNVDVPLTVNNGSITLTGGNLNISESSTLNSPIISVGATKNLDINGTSATATLSGTVTSTGAGTVSLQRGTLAGTATLNFAPGQFVVIGEANLAGAFTIPASSDLSVAGGSPNLSGTLSVAGKIIHGNAYFDLVSTTAAVRILSGGTYEANSSGFAIRHQGTTTSAGLTIESGGTLKSTTSTFNVDVPLTVNNGSITLTGGNLNISESSTLNSPIISVGATKNLDINGTGATATVSGTVTSTGAGTVSLQRGTLAGTATLNFAPGQFAVFGEPNLAGAFTIPASSDLSVAGASPNLSGTLSVSGKIIHGNAYLDLISTTAAVRVLSGGTYEANSGGFAIRHQVVTTSAGLTIESGATLKSTTSTFNVDVPLTVNNGNLTLTGGNLNISESSTLNSPIISVGATKNLDINGTSATATVSGTVTSTGAGTVSLQRGTLAGTATLNFAPGQFVVIGEPNLAGAFTIPASSDLSVAGASPNLSGTLTVSGKIIHGNAYLDLVSTTAAVRVLSGGTYEANSGGFAIRHQGTTTSAGLTIESGASFKSVGGSVSIDVPITNRGTIHAQGGNIGLGANVTGNQNGTLSGGKWIIDATRSMSVSGPAITTNAADVEISGTFNGFAPTTNSGTLSYRNGADFTSATRFTNTGTLSLGPGSTMTVAGFTQSSGGRVEFQIYGFNAANQGKIVSSAATNLAGTADIEIVPPFAPQGGTGYTLIQYPSKSGDFSTVTGLFLGHEKVFESFTEATQFRLNTTIDAGDLSVTSVTNPANGIAGQNVTISYTAQNVGVFEIPTNTWFDSIYLSSDAVLDASDILVKRLEITGSLAQNASYSRSVTTQLPGALPGDFHVFVVSDSRGFVADANRSNNTREGTTLALTVPVLTEGTVFTGTIADGQDLYFRVNMPAEKGRSFTLDTGAANAGGISVAFGNVPSRFGGLGFSADSDSHQEVLIPGGSAGEFYLHIHGKSSAGMGTSFSLLADALDLAVKSSSTKLASNIVFPTSPTVTTTVTGLEFSGNTTFSLVGSATIPATKVVFKDSTTAYVTFNLQGQPLGNYSLRADDGVANGTLPNAMQIVTGNGGTLDYNISSPTYIRAPFPGVKVTITYANTGLTDLPAPYFTLFPENAELKLDGFNDFITGPIGILGVAQDGLAGTIAPGASYKIEIPYRAINAVQGGTVGFTLQVLGNDAPPLDWALLEDSTRPQGVSEAGWQAAFANFKTSVGTSAQQFHSVLVDNANYLSQFGKVSYNTNQLIGFELQQADNFGEISGRFVQGKLGFGGLGPFATKATVDEFGSVTFSTGKSVRAFAKSGSSYVGVGISEAATVTAMGGAFLLTEVGGSKTMFRTDGQIDFIEDAVGGRLTGTYNASGELTGVTNSSNGDATTFTYISTAAGRYIRTITDPVGRVNTYSYNGTGDVTSVETTQGTTNFTYDTTPHAPKTVTGPNGVVTTYTYDAAGRIGTKTIGTGANAITKTFAYDSAGKITLTDGVGDTQIYRNLYGQVGRVIDTLGNISTAVYDAFGRATNSTDANGVSESTSYSSGLRPSVIALGDGTKVTLNFDARNLLAGIASPNGDATGFGYDAAGNLTNITQADGSFASMTYYPNGRIHTETASTGFTTTYTYNAAGLVSRKDLSTGEFVDFDYDAHRNLRTATDAEGTTTFTYTGNDLVESVSYPNGKTISFTYDSANRRETITEGGYTVRYAYDALGRLDTLRDGTNTLIIDYDYDSLGRLETETRGNGASTTYGYDDASRIDDIIHRDASNAIIEQFHYEYDSAGRIASATSTAGTTGYSYDANGQLVGAQLPGGRNLVYTYDVDGNRTGVSDNGVPTTFSANSADQYSTVGTKSLSYDASGSLSFIADGTSIQGLNYDSQGRLASFTEGANITTYDYDALGNRIGVIANGVRTDFAIDPLGLGTVFAESTGANTQHYANGIGLVGSFGTGGTSYFHYDKIGNTAALTGASSSVQNTYTYLPFGEVATQTGTTANRFTFGGASGVQDDVGDTFYMRARYYDAELGRFTQRDPIGLNGGDFNLYRFVGNDPVNASDPSGLFPTGFQIVETVSQIVPQYFYPQAGQVGFQVVETVSKIVPRFDPPPLVPAARTLVFNGAAALENTGVAVTQVGGQLVVATAAEVAAAVGVAAVGGYAIGTGVDQLTERTNPGLKQDFRNNLALGFNLAPDGLPGSNDLLNDVRYNQHLKTKGQDRIYQDFFEFYRKVYPEDRAREEATIAANRFRATDPEFAENYSPKPKVRTQAIAIGPRDPNQIIGPAGFGAEEITGDIFTQPVRFGGWVKGGNEFGYTVLFENKPDATAPAQIVTVTQTLDSDLDMATFELGSFGWADFEVTAPHGLTSWNTRVDAIAKLGVYVDVSASLNALTRLLTVTYTSIDPATGDVPTDPFAGFLPPNITAPQGDGFLTYSVKPLAGVTSGTEITAVASVVFDFEAALSTPTLTNKIDTVAPTGSVSAFANATSTRGKFAVNLISADEVGGSGLFGTTVFYREDGGDLRTFATSQPGTKFLFTAGTAGHTYTFYSAAQDNAGNLEALALTPDATISVIAPTILPVGKSRTFTDSDGDIYTVKLTGPGTLGAALLDPDGDTKGSLDQLFLTGSTAKTKVTITVKKAKTGSDGIVSIGDINVTGDLGAFTAKSSDFTMDGIVATGAVGKVAVRDFTALDAFLGAPGITTGGTAASKLKLDVAARNIGDGFLINTPTTINAITAASIGDGAINGATLGKLTTKTGAMNASLNIAGAVGSATIKGGVNVSQWTVGSIGAVTIGGSLLGDIDATTTIKSVTIKNGALNGQLTGTTIGAVSITGGDLGGFIGSSAPAGKVKGLASLSIAGGSLTGSVVVTGNVGGITVKESKTGTGGAISGPITANSIGAIAVTGGNITGDITSTGTSAALGKSVALASLTVTGGDLAADIRALGAIGAITVKTDKAGLGGNLNTASILAAKIAAITVAKNITDSILLAGASFGADRVLGGTDDTFAAGSIGAVNIGGNVVASTVGAGLSTTNASFKDADDTILGGVASSIAKLIIKGTADPASYFATGKFTSAPKIATLTVDPATDARFLVA